MADQASDKLPLQAYLESVLSQLAGALDTLERNHPSWEAQDTTLTLRAVLKPVTKDGETSVWIDVDVGAKELVSEIPLSLRRRQTLKGGS